MAALPRPRHGRHAARAGGAVARRWPLRRLAAVVTAAVGAGVLLYPSAAAWATDRVHATAVSGYVSTVDAIPADARDAMLEAARAYNENLPAGPLRDPYALGTDGRQTAVGSGAQTYFDTLDVDGRGTMARLRIPEIDVDLPIYHGTDEATLARGVGHLYGSALPVGGEGTHTVLTGHSGMVNATLFDHVRDLREGDEITVTVLDEVLTYRVDQILTVEPDDTEALRPVEGKDYLTLVTCTPIGVNTHRLLVRAERVETPAAAAATTTVAPAAQGPGFPWWAVGFAGIVGGAVLLTRPRPARAPAAAGRRRTGGPTPAPAV
ncbi:class C sortase [Puerhibacterium puerhi]|uniref:class C sortase n=1 Tax=Puerhibacterium puerhi TaxID=2692623 RepID=UPI00135C5C89|nr:class C sortase [Puerhibacterium puerhi]